MAPHYGHEGIHHACGHCVIGLLGGDGGGVLPVARMEADVDELMAGLRAEWLKAWAGRKAVWDMTLAEYEALADGEKMAMPAFGYGPSHSNYYVCVLDHAVWLGIGLGGRVWESLPRAYQNHLNFVNKGVDPVVDSVASA